LSGIGGAIEGAVLHARNESGAGGGPGRRWRTPEEEVRGGPETTQESYSPGVEHEMGKRLDGHHQTVGLVKRRDGRSHNREETKARKVSA